MRHLGRRPDRLRACFARMPDPRRGSNRRYAMADVGMAALSVFVMQSPSFLSHQRALAEGRGRSNAHTLFGMDRVPCDNHVRQMLDGVPAAHFDDEFHALVEDLDAHGALEPMRRLGGRVLVALDGTEYFRSRSIHCDRCSTRKRRDGGTEYFHQMLGAHIVAPGRNLTLPLPPEFVRPRDGTEKQDCERQAVKRWLARHGERCAALRPVFLGDDLHACQPVCQAMLDAGGDFLLTAKPKSHRTLHEFLDGIRLPALRRTTGRGAKRRVHRYRWMTDLPIRDGDDALRVNWIEVASKRPGGKVTYRGAFVTSLGVDRGNVAELADCARARWKIENETFNVPGSTATTSNTTSATARTPSPACSSSSTCSPSACTRRANSPNPSGRRPGSGSAPASVCSSTCGPSPNTRCSRRGPPRWTCSPPAVRPHSHP